MNLVKVLTLSIMKGFVYYIKSSHTPKVYVGSSIQTPHARMQGHKKDYREQYNNITSFKILCYDDAYMEVIEELEDDDRYNLIAQLLVREGHHIRTVDCVNKCIMGRTWDEYYADNRLDIIEQNKIWADANKEKVHGYKKKYDMNHKEQAKKYRTIPFICECGGECGQGQKARHFKSKMHIAYLKL